MGEYPTDDEIERIKAWPHEDPLGWFAFIKASGYWWPQEVFGWHERDDQDPIDKAVRVFDISTGGWSGNEDILGAMQDNAVLWLLTWHSTTRGGHYVFMVRV